MTTDNSSTIFTGILIADEIQRQNKQKLANQEYENNSTKEHLAKTKEEAKKLKNIEQNLTSENDDLNASVYMLQREVNYYKNLLCKPMAEIAEKNGNFKATYEKQMEIMADWMVSQKAFKELAIQFGFEQGQTKDDVVKKAQGKKIDVLSNKNSPNHNTNIDNSIDEKMIKKLKDKIQEK